MRPTFAVLFAIGFCAGTAAAADCAFEPLGPDGELTLGRPAGGSVVREFGDQWDDKLQKKAFHGGVDIESPLGEPVYAARTGRVVETGTKSEAGNFVRIDHGAGVETVYGDLGAVSI